MSAFADGIDNSIRMLELLRTMEDEVHAAAQSVSASVGMKGRVFVCGSSLSASPANLLADELNRKFYPVTGEVAAMSLCSDIKLISAVCLTSPDDVFASQLRARASENDLLFAMAFMDGKDFESARTAVLKALSLCPSLPRKSAGAAYNMAVVFAELKDNVHALPLLRVALEQDPANTQAQVLLDKIQAQDGGAAPAEGDA